MCSCDSAAVQKAGAATRHLARSRLAAAKHPAAARRALPLRALRERFGSRPLPPAWAQFLPTGCTESGLAHTLLLGPISSQSSCAHTVSSSSSGLPLAGHVWRLSRDADRCRDVQQALEDAGSNEEREAIAAELRGHIWKAIKDPHANHVILKCVVTLRPAACQFIIDELMEAHFGDGVGVLSAARDKYGCRIVQRLVEHCSDSQVWGLVEALLREVRQIAMDPFGNYVVQNLLQHAAEPQRRRLEEVLEADVHVLGQDTYGSAVLADAFLHGEGGFRRRLAIRVLQEPDLLVSMACTRHGHVAVLRLLAELAGMELEHARESLSKSRTVLDESKFGRAVVAYLGESQSDGMSRKGCTL